MAELLIIDEPVHPAHYPRTITIQEIYAHWRSEESMTPEELNAQQKFIKACEEEGITFSSPIKAAYAARKTDNHAFQDAVYHGLKATVFSERRNGGPIHMHIEGLTVYPNELDATALKDVVVDVTPSKARRLVKLLEAFLNDARGGL